MSLTPRKTTADLPRIEDRSAASFKACRTCCSTIRALMLGIFAALTVFLAWSASGLKVDAGF